MEMISKIMTSIQLAFSRRAQRQSSDKDPRSDQSFFLGGVPGFILSQDQRIIDWNIAFETAFSGVSALNRGMLVSDWYKELDNFRRIPNREAKLFGEAVLPITDRDRVVFISPTYGRMVFMKIMSPILDRISGRIIGWNITLNINSVTKRAKFFDDLYRGIDEQSRHSRYVIGAEQILSCSATHQQFVSEILTSLQTSNRILVLGAAKSESVVEQILTTNRNARVTVVDNDADALRMIRARAGHFQKRIRLVRRNIKDAGKIPLERFDAVLLFFPRFEAAAMENLLSVLSNAVSDTATIVLAGYNQRSAPSTWWSGARAELESSGQLDVLKWHWQTVSDADHETFRNSALVPLTLSDAIGFARQASLQLESASFSLLKGNASVLSLKPIQDFEE
ncbi:MAG: class I SAM-dependent methyltransferase, partial [Proteobacteria bacterium]|nr:class I SAM-dependent methyltransferase [Pseudomonadota bacterium]